MLSDIHKFHNNYLLAFFQLELVNTTLFCVVIARGTELYSQVGGIIMAYAASLKFLFARGDNPNKLE
jgi:hypothetical protein